MSDTPPGRAPDAPKPEADPRPAEAFDHAPPAETEVALAVNPGGSNKRQWVRSFVDYGPPIAFVVAYFASGRDFMVGTWVLVGASALALAVGWLVERRLAFLPLFAGLFALVFGALTLIFNDPSFVKLKLTFVNGALAAALLGGLVYKKLPLKMLLGEAIRLPEAAWRALSLRYGLWFLAVAAVNEVVWRTQPDETWVIFRGVLLPAAIVFSLAQVPFMMKHMEKDAPTPPDPGY